MTVANNSPFLNTHETAAYLSVSAGTLKTWRWEGKGPKYVKIGGAVRYRQSDLERFIRDNTRTTSETI